MKKLFWVFLVAAFLPVSARSREGDAALKLFEAAIEAMGGSDFLNVQDTVSTGNFFRFNRDGLSPLMKFTDYTRLPDKSRFELGNKKRELEITVFNLEKEEGWILEGQKEAKAATREEMRDFRNLVKHSMEVLFRVRYKDPRNKLFHLGPGEGRDITLERVRLIDPDNDEVTVYFDRASGLPKKLEFREPDAAGVRQRVVHEFSQWHWIQGVRTSLRTDGYVNGRPAFQIHIIEIKYNSGLADNLFSKPVPPK